MDKLDYDTPNRPEQHVIGDRAPIVFKYRANPEWVKNESESDYGWDLLINITENKQVTPNKGRQVKGDFWVQVKGTKDPKYDKNKENIRVDGIKTKTVRWLLSKKGPVMLTICDESDEENEPIYWVWLQEVQDTIKYEDKTGKTRNKISISIPTKQKLTRSKDCWKEIEKYVDDYWKKNIIPEKIIEIISEKEDKIEISNEHFEQYSSPIKGLEKAGMLYIDEQTDSKEIKGLSENDRELNRSIIEAVKDLKEFKEKDAQIKLERIANRIDQSDNYIKAKFYNAEGILALHKKKYHEALEFFKNANNNFPSEKKYELNRLHSEFYLSFESDEIPLRENWIEDIDRLIEQGFKSPNLYRLKANYIALTKSPETAEAYLIQIDSPDSEKVTNLFYIAESYLKVGNKEKALSLLQRAEKIETEKDGLFWCFYGSLNLDVFLDSYERRINFIGNEVVTTFDDSLLLFSKNCFSNAISKFQGNIPEIADVPIANYIRVLLLLEEFKEAKKVIQDYLYLFPDNLLINSTKFELLFRISEFKEAINLAKSLGFDNITEFVDIGLLSGCAFNAKEFDIVIDIFRKREEENSFKDDCDEGNSRVIALLSYSQLGKYEDADKQIEILKNNVRLKKYHYIAKIKKINYGFMTDNDVNTIFEKALDEFPEDDLLLSNYLLYLNPTSSTDSKKIIDTIEKLRRPLLYEEYLIYVQSLLTNDAPERALEIIKETITKHPDDLSLLFYCSIVYQELGDYDKSYSYLKKLIDSGKDDPKIYEKMARYAFRIGKFDESLKYLSKALSQTRNKDDKRIIHLMIYHLLKITNGSNSEMIRHLYEYGKDIEEGEEEESQFLILFLTTPIPDYQNNQVLKDILMSVKKKLDEFPKKYPDSKFLKKFGGEDSDPQETVKEINKYLEDLRQQRTQETEKLRISFKNNIYPFAFRVNYLPEINCIFSFWDECIKSSDFNKSLFIFGNYKDIQIEHNYAIEANDVVIDINSLLTLAEFDLLKHLLQCFKMVIISESTMAVILSNIYEGSKHNIAIKINNWYINNKDKIRIRNIDISNKLISDDKKENFIINSQEYNFDEKNTIKTLKNIHYGVGETVILANRLNKPLYSDDCFIRAIAGEMGLQVFSTLSLLHKLTQKDIISREDELKYLSNLIASNFMILPITHLTIIDHIKNSLVKAEGENETYAPKEDDILQNLLKPLIKKQMHYFQIEQIISNLWESIIIDDSIPMDVTGYLFHHLSFFVQLSFDSPVLNERNMLSFRTHGGKDMFSRFHTKFLINIYRNNKSYIKQAWLLMSECAKEIFKKETGIILFNLIPNHLISIIENEISNLNREQKSLLISEFSRELPNGDSDKFEQALYRIKPSLF